MLGTAVAASLLQVQDGASAFATPAGVISTDGHMQVLYWGCSSLISELPMCWLCVGFVLALC